MVGVAIIVGVLHHRPRPRTSRSATSSRSTVNDYGLRRSGTIRSRAPTFWFVLRTRAPRWRSTRSPGFDASAHMAEETHQASRMAAVGMYMSVVVSVIFGFILLVAVTFAIPGTSRRDRPLHHPVESGSESMSQNWAEFLLFICVVAQFFCLTASTTSASRMMFAFSRDRAVPGPPALATRVATEPRPGYAVFGDLRRRGDPHAPDDLELLRRLLRRHRRSR